MMRVLIVDDEAAARRRLHLMLEELDVEVVGDAANGVEALALTRERKPDVLLLDIAMPEVDGFDVVRHLPQPRPLIVFQTAHDEFALRAFEHEALDYVVKLVELQRLRRAMDRARKRLDASGSSSLPAARTPDQQNDAGSGMLRLLRVMTANNDDDAVNASGATVIGG